MAATVSEHVFFHPSTNKTSFTTGLLVSCLGKKSCQKPCKAVYATQFEQRPVKFSLAEIYDGIELVLHILIDKVAHVKY
jgi:hypothetical protein